MINVLHNNFFTIIIAVFLFLSYHTYGQNNNAQNNSQLLTDQSSVDLNTRPIDLLQLTTEPQKNTLSTSQKIDDTNDINIIVDELERIDPSTLGVLDISNGGYGFNLWGDLSRHDIKAKLKSIQPFNMIPALRDALSKMLLSSANLPKGDLLPGNILDQWDVMRERLGALIRLGMLQDAYDMVQIFQIQKIPYDIRIWRAELAIWNGNWQDACQTEKQHQSDLANDKDPGFSIPITDADTRYWNELNITCLLFNDETLDSLTIEFALESGKIKSEFAFLLEAIINDIPLTYDTVKPSNILQSRLLFLAGHDYHWDYNVGNQSVFRGDSLKNYHLPKDNAKNIIAANYLYTQNIISLDDLVKSYALISKKHKLDYPLSVDKDNHFIGNINDPIARAVNYYYINTADDTKNRLSYARAYIKESQQQNSNAIIRDASALYELVNSIRAEDSYRDFAPMMVQIGFIVGDKQMIQDWDMLLDPAIKEKMLLWYLALYGLEDIEQAIIIKFLTNHLDAQNDKKLLINNIIEALLYRDEINLSGELWLAMSRLQTHQQQQQYAHPKIALEYLMQQSLQNNNIVDAIFYAIDAFPNNTTHHNPVTIARIYHLLDKHLKLSDHAWRYLVKQLLHHHADVFF